MNAPNSPKETWKEKANRMDWPEFREWVLDMDPLQTVNLPWWKEQHRLLQQPATEANNG